MNIFSNSLIIERLKLSMNVGTDKELAEKLGTNSSTLANWKKPTKQKPTLAELVFKYAENHNVDLNWLIFGKENKPALDEMEQMLLNNYKRLDPAQKLQLLNASLNGVGSGINQVANGDNNKQQLITGNVGEVTGIRK